MEQPSNCYLSTGCCDIERTGFEWIVEIEKDFNVVSEERESS